MYFISVSMFHISSFIPKEAFTEMTEKKKSTPHICNVNFDPQLSGKMCQFIEADKVTVGNSKGDPSDIVLSGPRYVLDQNISMDNYM